MDSKTDSSGSGNTERICQNTDFGRIIKLFMYGSWVGGMYISFYTLFTGGYISSSCKPVIVFLCMYLPLIASVLITRHFYCHAVAIIKIVMFPLLIVTVLLCLPLSDRLLPVLFYMLVFFFGAITGALAVYGFVELRRSPALFKKLLVLIAACVPMNLIPVALQKFLCCSTTLVFAIYVSVTASLFVYIIVTEGKSSKTAEEKKHMESPPETAPDKCEAAVTQKEKIFPQLSEQEHNLAILILKGYTEGDICKEMNITINTQKSYRKSVYSKLDIHSKQELFELAGKGTDKSAESPWI